MKKRRYILLLMIIMLILPLTGCVKYNANMDIKKDKSMYFSIIYAVDTSYFGNQEILDSKGKKELEEAGFTITDYKDGKMSGFTIARNIKNIDFVSSEDADGYSLSGILEKDAVKAKIFKVKKGFLKNTYVADFKFDAADSGMDSKSYIESNTNLRKALDPDMSSEIDMNELESSLAKTLDLSFNVTLPYSAISSNANSKNDNNRSLSWNLSSSEASSVKFEFALYNTTNIYMTVGGGIALLVIVLIAIMNNKNKSGSLCGAGTKSSIPIVGGPSIMNSSSNVPSNIAVVPPKDSETNKSSQIGFDSTLGNVKEPLKEENKNLENDKLSFNDGENKSELQAMFNPTDVFLASSDTINNTVLLNDEKTFAVASDENGLGNNLEFGSINNKQEEKKEEPVTLSLRPIDNNGNAIVNDNNIMTNNNLGSQDNVPVMQAITDNTLKDDGFSSEKSDESPISITASNDLTSSSAENSDTNNSNDGVDDNQGGFDATTNDQNDIPVMQSLVEQTLVNTNVSLENEDNSIASTIEPNNFTLGPVENSDTKDSSAAINDNQNDVPIMQNLVEESSTDQNISLEKSDESPISITVPNDLVSGPVENGATNNSSDGVNDNQKDFDVTANNQSDVSIIQSIADNTLQSKETGQDKSSDINAGNQDDVENSIDLVVNPVTSFNEINSNIAVETKDMPVIQDTVGAALGSNTDEKSILQNVDIGTKSNESSELKQDISNEAVRNLPDMLIEKKILPLDSPVMIDEDINS